MQSIVTVAVRQLNMWRDFVNDHPVSNGDLAAIAARCDAIKDLITAVLEYDDEDMFHDMMAAWHAVEEAIRTRLSRPDGCYAK